MFCDYCHGYGYHKPGCPLNEPFETDYICSICGECIQKGDEYLENDDGEMAHWECINYGMRMLEFLGYTIKIMEDDE